jgi:hypothetical protein
MKKHEREIRELLEKMDSFLPDSPPVERTEREREPKKKVVGVMPPAPRPIPIRKKPSARFGSWLRAHKISTALACVILAFALAVTGLIIGSNFRSVWLAQAFIAAGAIVFLLPLLVRFFTGRDLNDDVDGSQHWRGQPLDDSGFSWQTVKGWFQKNRRRPSIDPWNDRNNRNPRW